MEFLCGDRAVRRARADHDLLTRLAGQFSASADELPALVEAQRAELKEAAAARRELEAGLSELRARDLHAAALPDAGGVRSIALREDGPIERLRPLALAVGALPRAVFVGWATEPPAVIVASSVDSGVDAGPLLRAALAQVGGRGGGNARLAQGTAPSAAALEEAVAAIVPGRTSPARTRAPRPTWCRVRCRTDPGESDRLVARQATAVGPVGGQRLVDVGHGECPAHRGEPIPGQAEVVALPVEPLVMRGRDAHDPRKRGHPLENPLGVRRMHPHLGALPLGEPVGLVQDQGGDAQLADVVQQAGAAKVPQLHFAKVQPPADGHRQLGHPLGVEIGVR